MVTGATWQIWSELVPTLRKIYWWDNIIAVWNKTQPTGELLTWWPFEIADVRDKERMRELMLKYNIDIVYHLVGLLSATWEQNPNLARDININWLKNMLDLSVEYWIKKFFWPSSIAAFWPNTPRKNTPQFTVMDPTTMYWTSKVAWELLCQYYYKKYNLDTRSLRYPWIVSRKTLPWWWTTDYAVAIYYDAIQKWEYTFFVNEETILPMMYMPDAIKATIDIMDADASIITIHTSYNLTWFSFSAKDLENNLLKYIPNLKCNYNPDYRQNIADSRPQSIDDSITKKDRNRNPDYDLDAMSIDMIKNLKEKFSK